MPPKVLLVSSRAEISDSLLEDPGSELYELETRLPEDVDPERAAHEFTAVLIDFDTVPDGVSLGRALRAANREVEFIPIAGVERERQAVEALKVGAFDYQIWPPPEPWHLYGLVARCLRKVNPEPVMGLPRPFGRFTLQRRLGVGGMAEVFLATLPPSATSSGGQTVIKQMLPVMASNDEYVRMFMDEVRITSVLVHPNIVRVSDCGRIGEIPYMAMEYVAGRNLEELRNELNAPFPPGLACWIVAEICAGLGHAHDKVDREGVPLGIVHRDVNPPNVLISDTGRVMLTDFGIAKAAHRYYETTSGVLKGKFEYMSPEQAYGKPVDRRTDLFSAGLILYELLASARAFQAQSPVETLFLIQQCEPAPPSTHDRKISPELDRIVLKALARDPVNRYQQAADLERDLRAFATKTSNPGALDLAAFSRTVLEARRSQSPSEEPTDAVVKPGHETQPGLIPQGASDEPTAAVFRLDQETSTSLVPDELSGETTRAPDALVSPGQPVPEELSGVTTREPGHPVSPSTLVSGQTMVNADAAALAAAPAYPRGGTPEGTVIRAMPRGGVESKEEGSVPDSADDERTSGIFPGATVEADRRRRMITYYGGAALGGMVVLALLVPLSGAFRMSSTSPTATPYGESAEEDGWPIASDPPEYEATPRIRSAATPARAAASPRPSAVSTAAPIARSSPTPVAPKPTAVPNPKPPLGKGTLSVWVEGWATVEIDGKPAGVSAPFAGLSLPAGKHVLVLQNQWTRKQMPVVIERGKETKLSVDLR